MRRPPPSDGETHRARWSRERNERIAANGPRESFTRQEIGDRDGWVCGICGDPVDHVRYRAPDPRSADLDHIRPVAQGGTHSRANVRITHRFCNANRHDDDGFTDDELVEQQQHFVRFLQARGLDVAGQGLDRPRRRLSEPDKARRALAARVARMSETKPTD